MALALAARGSPETTFAQAIQLGIEYDPAPAVRCRVARYRATRHRRVAARPGAASWSVDDADRAPPSEPAVDATAAG